MHIDQVEFTIFDTETTGLDFACGERLVEIAGARFKADTVIAKFDSLVNSGKAVSAKAFAVNKISPEMLQGAPGMEKVIPEFLRFSENSCLASYNTNFDLGFLNNELTLLNLPLAKSNQAVDILTLARNVLPGLPRYALWFVAERLGIKNNQQHRAYADVELTLQVFMKLKSIVLDSGLSDFNDFFRLALSGNQFKPALAEKRMDFLKAAVESKRKIFIEYLSAQNNQITQRQIIPRLLRRDGACDYLVAYCFLKQQEVIFKVENILKFSY
ncbi:MAG: exonuclease domain-containing protein [Candidatus Omnitrophica bacterium]|jgi:DNA polymerase III epsilon subunit family exonuclease|nr:exonuclease domain-containing protein [Candidatus Omnitrophota bacterium]